MFQFTAARRRLRVPHRQGDTQHPVSIHSRPKAAACVYWRLPRPAGCFNSQPPEGGCTLPPLKYSSDSCFNSQPPEGGCLQVFCFLWSNCKFQFTAARRRLRQIPAQYRCQCGVSIHSRPKAAACSRPSRHHHCRRFNSQPPEGGCLTSDITLHRIAVSIHSRPKAAAADGSDNAARGSVSIHSRPKAAARPGAASTASINVSIHSRPKAAARPGAASTASINVSIHSRPKAAAGFICCRWSRNSRFNSQPPEGGCTKKQGELWQPSSFNSQPPEGGCAFPPSSQASSSAFQFTAARRRLRSGQRAARRGWCFNSQPPEGGCAEKLGKGQTTIQFQFTAARRRLRNARRGMWIK